MNSAGETLRSPSGQRASASSPCRAPVRRSTIGWKNVRRRRLADRLAQLGLERQPVDHAAMHAGVERPAAATALRLGVVHRDVGVADQLLAADPRVEVCAIPMLATIDSVRPSKLTGSAIACAGARGDLDRLRGRR